MTHKFSTTVTDLQENKDNPVLFKIVFNNGYYYYHKGKSFDLALNRLLYDVFRATLIRDKPLVISEDYIHIVEYCKKYPQVNKVSAELILNDTPENILDKEKKLWTKAKKDHKCLNRKDKLPYTPEWMIRHLYIKRCNSCPSEGNINKKKEKFIFCPRCGKTIK